MNALTELSLREKLNTSWSLKNLIDLIDNNKIMEELIDQNKNIPTNQLQNMEEMEGSTKKAVFGERKMLKTKTNSNKLLLGIMRMQRKTKMKFKKLD
jgi:hypothetical protein